MKLVVAAICCITLVVGGVLPVSAADESPSPLRFISLQQATKTGKAPVLDGRIRDKCWETTPSYTTFYDFTSSTPEASPVKTISRACYDSKGIYLAIHNYEDKPQNIQARHSGGEIWRDDSLEVYISKGPNNPEQYHNFSLNAAGKQWSETRSRDKKQAGGAPRWGVVQGPNRTETDVNWEATVAQNSDGWDAEIFIPWKSVGAKATEGDVWRFALTRFSYTEGHRFVTSAPGAKFDAPGQFGYLYFGRLKRGDKGQLKRLADAIAGNWILPIHNTCIIKNGMIEDGIHWYESLQKAASAYQQTIKDGLRTAQKRLGEQDVTLKQAADRLLTELRDTPDRTPDSVTLAQKVQTLNNIVHNLSHLDPEITITGPRTSQQKGVDVFQVKSPYLGGTNAIEVLLPDDYNNSQNYPVLYILPVNAGIGGRYGDCLQKIQKSNLHNEHDIICVTMAFDSAPWYADHPTDPSMRQASYVSDLVVPLIEKHYSTVDGKDGRLLLGFSKSGWGSMSLLLRNPDFYGYACSWDAPLLMDKDDFGIWTTEKQFGTADNMMRYSPVEWAGKNAEKISDSKRLVLLGHKFFGNRWASPKNSPHTRTYHQHLQELNIPHSYDNTVEAPHNWNLQWLRPAINKLMKLASE